MDVKIAVVQLDCVLGDVEANLNKIERFVASAALDGVNVVVVPELGTTGYFVGDRLNELAEPVPGPTTERLGAIARKHNTYLVSGMIERADDGRLYNASVMLSPKGELVGRYRKCHLFSAEKEFFSLGDRAAVVDTEFGRVALTICYDLVFPEYIRSLVLQGAQLILNSTDWITDAWQTSKGWGGEVVSHLAATRALENTVHVAMADRVGVEAGWKSLGHSCICAPSGSFLARIEEGEGVAIATAELDSPEWEKWRSIATYLPDRRTDFYAALQWEAAEKTRG
jgi:predicted amidohydrolase